MELKFLITGTGRCGTLFMTQFLCAAGMPCGHESIFDFCGLERAKRKLNGEEPVTPSVISKVSHLGEISAESSYMAAPFLDDEIFKNTKIIHLVRNPIKVVDSFINGLEFFSDTPLPHAVPYENYIYHFFPELKDVLNQADRACLYYVLWNEMIEQKLANREFLFHRIEDDLKPAIDYLSMTNIDIEHWNSQKTINTLPRVRSPKFSIFQIKDSNIKKRFIEIGGKYGYQIHTALFL